MPGLDALPFAATIDRDARRALVRGAPGLDGIDFVEVLSNHAGSPAEVPGAPAQRTLLVHTLNQSVPDDWDADRVHVIGGVRADPKLNPVRVAWAYPAAAVAGTTTTAPVEPLAGVSAADRSLVAQALPGDDARRRALVVRTLSSGDWSTYTLRLVGDAGQPAPVGFDLPLASAPFTFTVDCPSDLDCRPESDCPGDLVPGPLVDYLARDYEGLRTRLLDRLSTLLPDWTDRNPADPAVMLVELFAYVGDRLAYWQDAVAVEAYLSTARHRTSVRRHARLLNYPVHEGCSARTLLAFSTDTDLVVAAGTAVADSVPEGTAALTATPGDATQIGGTVFETCLPLRVTPERNALPLYAWGDPDHCLVPGTTSAFVSSPAGADPLLRRGDVLVLADQPVNGSAREGDPGLRAPVRLDTDPVRHQDPLDPGREVWEIRWHADDALQARLQVTTPGTTDARAVALANVVVADHGATIQDEPLEPPTAPAAGRYAPRLAQTGLTFVDLHLPASASAHVLLAPDPRSALAAVRLDDGERSWEPQPDLLASGRLSAHFVVEPEAQGVARLRFGDDINGRAPGTGAVLLATYRVGGGSAGNVAPDRLVHPLRTPGGAAPFDAGANVSVWNPLPGAGGTDPQALEEVRQLAPTAFRHQLRAVTSADYAAVAMSRLGVQRAVSRRRWAGSWYAEEVTTDPVAARAADPALVAELAAVLEVRRMAGIDVELTRPIYVALHLELFGCVQPGYLRADVERRLRDVFSARARADGSVGFFHPDRFTFGEPLVLSEVVAAAMGVQGLAWVELNRFARMGATAHDAQATLLAGELAMAPREVLRCDSDPSNPESGRIDLSLGGGS